MFISPSTSFKKNQSTGDPLPADPSSRDYFSLGDITSFIRRYWITIILPMAITLVACITYLKVATPIFSARAQIIIDPRVQEQWNGQTGNAVLALDTAQVESQIAVLRSERIAKSVIADLHLTDAQDFQPQPSLLRRLLAPIWPPPQIEMSSAARSRFIMEAFAGNLDVRRSGMSYAIDITFSSPNPDRAAQVANATAEAYIRYQLAARSETARVGGDWLEARTFELRNQMSAATRAVQEFKARRDYRIARAGDGRLDGTSDAAGETAPASKVPANTLEELETTAQIYQRVYESFLQGFTESVQRQSFPVADAHVLTSATAPFSKTQPRGAMTLMLGLLVSGLAGGGIALLRHQLDHTIRSTRQVRTELGIECLGALPVMRFRKKLHLRKRYSSPAAPQSSTQATTRHLRQTNFGHLTMEPALFAPPARNAMAAIIERIEICMRPAERFSFGITSHNEGKLKSVLARNISSMFSFNGRRTLLVDTNVQNYMTNSILNSPRPGLIEAALGLISLEQAIETPDNSSIEIIHLGDTTALPAIFRQDDTARLKTTISNILKNYDVVIFDLPPMNHICRNIATYLLFDGIIVEIESEKTTKKDIEDNIYWLRTLNYNIIGAIITNISK
ncbi:exopolysaccharide transport family protein [Ancylobacter sp. Lp-2]|uniref:GumC family protein n=1 Tax=Ancylobacter sp. Lp-2 TaxID=2881339 RepID=UPI001E2FA19F|nr:exopolysaccharide transport family protein [Ancylobacter sp. Lp-2]MCB4769594.1 exopolysaccharide transport family protein [Ancylobacter sp. Lp-2]